MAQEEDRGGGDGTHWYLRVKAELSGNWNDLNPAVQSCANL